MSDKGVLDDFIRKTIVPADAEFSKTRLILFIFYDIPTRPRMMWTRGGTEVRATVIVPSNPMLKLEKAAARGSVVKSSAVATADEFAPSVIPRVM